MKAFSVNRNLFVMNPESEGEKERGSQSIPESNTDLKTVIQKESYNSKAGSGRNSHSKRSEVFGDS